MGWALSRFLKVSCVVWPIWCMPIDVHPCAMAVAPATRSAPVFTSLWHLANAGSFFQVTLSESGLVGSGGSPALSMAACCAARDWAEDGGFASAPPPPQPKRDATARRASEERQGRVVRMAGGDSDPPVGVRKPLPASPPPDAIPTLFGRPVLVALAAVPLAVLVAAALARELLRE